jgi:hypothetical protein
MLGVIGFLLSWIALELTFPFLFELPYSSTLLLGVVYGGAVAFGLLGIFRNRTLQYLARRGFVAASDWQRFFDALFWAAGALALYVPLAPWGVIPNYNTNLTLFFMGLFFLMVMPRLVFFPVFRRTGEARLSLQKFLVEKDMGRTDYFWLRNGLSSAERHLRRRNRLVSKGTLYTWASFSLSKGLPIERELNLLGEMLAKGQASREFTDLLTNITVHARAAERARFKPPKGLADIPSLFTSATIPLIWKRDDKLSNLFVIAFLSSLILAVLSFNLPFALPLPQWYLQGASLALFASFVSVATLLSRRKPPAKVMRLISEVYGGTRVVDEMYDAPHILGLIKLLTQKQKAINNLEPVLHRVAPKVHESLSDLISVLGVKYSSKSQAEGFEVTAALLLNPQTRLVVSDLRKDSEEWLSEHAYEDSE